MTRTNHDKISVKKSMNTTAAEKKGQNRNRNRSKTTKLKIGFENNPQD